MKRIFVFDTETMGIPKSGTCQGWPDFVVMGYCVVRGGVPYTGDLVTDRSRARSIVQRHLEMEDCVVVGHNLTFDLGVLGLKVRKNHLVHDTMIVDMLQRLVEDDCDLNKPGPPVPQSLERLFGRKLAGKETVRVSFVPGSPITDEQAEYLRNDVMATLGVYNKQVDRHIPGGYNEVRLQLRASQALAQLEQTGINVDNTQAAVQQAAFERIRRRAAAVLRNQGMYEPKRVGKKGGEYNEKLCTKPFKEHVLQLCKDQEIRPQYTDKGNLKTDRQFLLVFQDDDMCKAWLDYKDAQKMVSTFLKAWSGTDVVHPRYRVLVRTGRTSSYGPNLQQVPSRGDRGKVKKVFIPPPGRVFFELDYCQLELCCLAYLTQGEMWAKINAGQDLHRYLATIYFQKKAEEVTKQERQLMKCANFGLPGGMGTAKFRTFIRQNGLPDPGEAGAKQLFNAWIAAYPEMSDWLDDCVDVPYQWQRVWSGKDDFPDPDTAAQAWAYAAETAAVYRRKVGRHMPKMVRDGIRKETGSYPVERWITGRKVVVAGGRSRSPVSYTEWHNTRFQGIAANLTKHAMARLVLEECESHDILVHGFVHDSFLVSVPEGAEALADRVAEVMLGSAEKWIPGVRAGVEIVGPGKSWYEAKNAQAQKIEKLNGEYIR